MAREHCLFGFLVGKLSTPFALTMFCFLFVFIVCSSLVFFLCFFFFFVSILSFVAFIWLTTADTNKTQKHTRRWRCARATFYLLHEFCRSVFCSLVHRFRHFFVIIFRLFSFLFLSLNTRRTKKCIKLSTTNASALIPSTTLTSSSSSRLCFDFHFSLNFPHILSPFLYLPMPSHCLFELSGWFLPPFRVFIGKYIRAYSFDCNERK